jgi:hypothetical protein
VAHPQTDGGRNSNALTSFLFRNEAATFGAKDTDSSSFSVASGKRYTSALNTSSFFPFRNEAFAAKCAEEEEEEESSRRREAAGQREAASRGSCTGRERARSSSVTEAGSKSSQGSQGSQTGRRDRYAVAGRLDEYGSGNLMEEQRTSRPGRKQELVPEEDPAAAADGAAAKPMPEPTTQPTTNTRSSRSAGPPEKQPWTFGGAYWPPCK